MTSWGHPAYQQPSASDEEDVPYVASTVYNYDYEENEIPYIASSDYDYEQEEVPYIASNDYDFDYEQDAAPFSASTDDNEEDEEVAYSASADEDYEDKVPYAASTDDEYEQDAVPYSSSTYYDEEEEELPYVASTDDEYEEDEEVAYSASTDDNEEDEEVPYVTSTDDEYEEEEVLYVASTDDEYEEQEGPYVASTDDECEEEEVPYVASTDDEYEEEEVPYSASTYYDDDEEEAPYSTCGEAEPFASGSGHSGFGAQWSSSSSQSSKMTYSFGSFGASKPTCSQGAPKAVTKPASKAPAKVDCVKKVLPQYLEKPYKHNVYGLPTNATVVLYCDVPWPCKSRKEFLTIELCADNDLAMQVLIKAQARVQLPTPIAVQCRQNGQWHHVQNYTLDLSGSRHKFMITVRKNDYQVNIAGKHVVNYGHMIAPSAISAIRIAGTVSDWAPKLEIYGLHGAQ